MDVDTTTTSYFSDESLDLDVLDKFVVACVRDLFASEIEMKELESVRTCKLPGLSTPSGNPCMVQRGGEVPTLEDYNRHRIACERARAEVLRGNIQEAIAVAKTKYGGDGAALEDARLLFKLYKQHFLELSRGAKTTKDTQRALEWCRENLAPAALVAYPEAYDEFKSAMLSVVSNSHLSRPKLSDQASEEEEEDRKVLAGALSGAMKKATKASQPQLVLILRHLLSSHKVFSQAKYHESRVEPRTSLAFQVVDSLDAPMLPEEGVLGCFPEGDVLTLRDAAAISNQEAIEALKRTQPPGDIHFALRNELGRVRLKENLLEEILAEYALYRGLFTKETEKLWNEAARHSKALAGCYQEWRKSEEVNDSAYRIIAAQEDNGGDHNGDDGMRMQQHQDLPATSRYTLAYRIAARVVEGKVSEAIRDLSKFFPSSSGLAEKHPRLAFELKRFQVLELLGQGRQEDALNIARSDLSVLAERDPTLLPTLKKTMIAFCHVSTSSGGDDRDVYSTTTTDLDSIIDTVLGALGAAPPRLVQLFKSLLRAHRIWYDELEMCQDRFEDVLGIAHLKKKRKKRKCDGSQHMEEEDAIQGGESYSLEFPECTILTLMEFLSSTRAQAIELLMQHEGSLEQCLETIFG
jgi:hypothetical protein